MFCWHILIDNVKKTYWNTFSSRLINSKPRGRVKLAQKVKNGGQNLNTTNFEEYIVLELL